jgi:16S rRNA (uracil1498-N3)-methyltransferase
MSGSDQARLKVHRFFGSFAFDRPIFVIEDRDVSRQIVSVLRLRPGELIVLLDGSGDEAVARITSADASGVEVSVVEKRRCSGEPARRASLYAAVLKRENFEFVVQKAVEVGVSRIVPVLSGRTVKLGIKRDRLMKIAREAAEQSGRGVIPEVSEPMKFKDALREARSNDANVFFEIGAAPLDGPALKEKVKVGTFIGPEGGWTEEELSAAADAGFAVAGLGSTTMRAETAAIVAVFLAVQSR